MARTYTLHQMPTKLEARCPICIKNWTWDNAKGMKIDLPEHTRQESTERCPGSGMTVTLRYQVKSPSAAPEPDDVPKDTDPFPFGEHKTEGHTYGQVPADYFDWVQDQPWIHKWPKVLAYIKANKAAIEKEL